jgi:hypothetical protein
VDREHSGQDGRPGHSDLSLTRPAPDGCRRRRYTSRGVKGGDDKGRGSVGAGRGKRLAPRPGLAQCFSHPARSTPARGLTDAARQLQVARMRMPGSTNVLARSRRADAGRGAPSPPLPCSRTRLPSSSRVGCATNLDGVDLEQGTEIGLPQIETCWVRDLSCPKRAEVRCYGEQMGARRAARRSHAAKKMGKGSYSRFVHIIEPGTVRTLWDGSNPTSL